MGRLAYLGTLLLGGLVCGVAFEVAGRCSFSSANQAVPAGGFKPGKLPDDVVATLVPGLTLRMHNQAMIRRVVEARIVRLAAFFDLQERSPSSSLLMLGEVELSGFLKEKLNSERRFKLVGVGTAVLLINNMEVARLDGDPGPDSRIVKLAQGYNKITVHYNGPAKGDAKLRVYWSSDEFGWEPLPPDQLFTDGGANDLAAFTSSREGRLLFATHGCMKCHGLPPSPKPEQSPMPELRQQPPSLENAGHRFNENWLAAWTKDPNAWRPEATMPVLLHGDEAKQQAWDLAAYLASLKVGEPWPPSKVEEELTADGEQKFIRMGCVACHHLDAPEKKDEHGRLSLHHVKAKFAPGALEAFLLAPHKHYPWSRMPDFKLTDEEAAALTSYLLKEAKGDLEADNKPAGDSKRGAKLFIEVGCSQCHVSAAKAELPGPTRAFPDGNPKGCLADNPGDRGKAPAFVLPKPQKGQLLAFLSTGRSSLSYDTPAEFSMRQVKLLQCHACHNRDGAPSRWYTVLAEFGTQPETLPPLTWTGEKLHPEWTEKLLAGQHENRARPWLGSRMPAFPTRAAQLAIGLSHEHGFAVNEDPRPAPDPKLAQIGKGLLPQMGGFNCVQCHAVGGEKAVAPFGNDGINLLDAGLRLRYEYYTRWMLFLKRVDPTAAMTQFSEDGKTTALTEVLDGNARRQFDAIWHYMQTLPDKDR